MNNKNNGKMSFFSIILIIFGAIQILPFMLGLIMSLIVAFFPIIIFGLFGFLVIMLINLLRQFKNGKKRVISMIFVILGIAALLPVLIWLMIKLIPALIIPTLLLALFGVMICVLIKLIQRLKSRI